MPFRIGCLERSAAVEVQAIGPIGREAIVEFLPRIADAIRNRHGVRMLLCVCDADDGHEVPWESFGEDLWVFENVARLAVIGKRQQEVWIAGLCKPFTTATTRCFRPDQKDQARRWLLAE